VSEARVELRCQRLLWKVCAYLIPHRWVSRRGRLDRRRVTRWVFIYTTLLFAAGLLVTVAVNAAIGPVGFYAGPLFVLLAPVAGALVMIAGGLWYGTGAGKPVLVVDGDELRGRLRPITPDGPADGPDDPGWWDLQLPVTSLRGVRIARADQRAWKRLLVLDLPPEIAVELLNRPGLEKRSAWNMETAGSPAAWNAGAMLPVGRRRSGLRRLVAGLERARVPGG
jgi:hypothetical protein